MNKINNGVVLEREDGVIVCPFCLNTIGQIEIKDSDGWDSSYMWNCNCEGWKNRNWTDYLPKIKTT